MMPITWVSKNDKPLKILCLGAHADDIEIGCGGTILTLAKQYHYNIDVQWCVFSAHGDRESEAQRSANAFFSKLAAKDLKIYHYRDGYFPSVAAQIKETFEEIKHQYSPDVVFTHYRDDRHQDHRVISDLTWNTFRNHLILEYEIPKYDGDMGSPNVLVSIDKKICKKKCALILKHFKSQSIKHWLTEETLVAILRLRGIESGRSAQYAEGFYCRKLSL